MSAATQKTLVIDRQNNIIVKVGSSVSTLPKVSQRDKLPLLIKICDPATNSINGTPTIITSTDVSDGRPRVTVASQATPLGGDEETYLLAKLREDDFTWDAAQGGFTGILNLNTEQMETYMIAAGGNTVSVDFEVRFSKDGDIATILSGPRNKITVTANDDEGSDPSVDIIGGVPVLRGPLQVRFDNGHVYILTENVTETGLDFNRI